MSNKEYINSINEIRDMMSRSIRFLSLSGYSGIFSGFYAIVAAVIVYYYSNGNLSWASYSLGDIKFFVIIAIGTLVLSILTSFIFTRRKAKKNGVKLWDETTRNVILNFCTPLLIGGLLCLSFIYHGSFGYLAPTTLIFYGLALINASSYTFPTVKQLGYVEVFLGLVNSFFIGYGLIFWLIGFGLLHIIYGIFMFYKYDKK